MNFRINLFISPKIRLYFVGIAFQPKTKEYCHLSNVTIVAHEAGMVSTHLGLLKLFYTIYVSF
jgi:hypothetical protein